MKMILQGQTKCQRMRWWLADWFSYVACRLRGHRWFMMQDCLGATPGNRAAELRQSIWERCVVLEMYSNNQDAEWLNKIEADLNELGQLALEAWGHRPIPPEGGTPNLTPRTGNVEPEEGLTANQR